MEHRGRERDPRGRGALWTEVATAAIRSGHGPRAAWALEKLDAVDPRGRAIAALVAFSDRGTGYGIPLTCTLPPA